LGALFNLSNFERLEDIHVAVGDAQYGLAGIVMISTVGLAIAMRLADRRRDD
jgi:hypothetical protein